MASVIFAILVVCVLAIMLMPRSQPPMVIYVEQEPAPRVGVGCLPLIVIVIVVLIALRVI